MILVAFGIYDLMRISFSGLLIVALLGSAKTQACELTFAVSNEFPPHHMQEDSGAWRGVTVDLFQWMANGAGCAVSVVNVPWDRTINYLEQGKVDAVSLFTKSDERQKFTHFIGPHYQESIVVIVAKSHADSVNTHKELVKFDGLIGKTPGTDYGKSLQTLLGKEQLKENLVDIVSNDIRIKMFKAGRVDAILEEASVAEHLFKTKRLDPKKHRVKLEFAVNPVYFGFSRNSVDEKTLESLKQSWAKMIERDAIHNVYQQYGLSYTPIAANAQ